VTRIEATPNGNQTDSEVLEARR